MTPTFPQRIDLSAEQARIVQLFAAMDDRRQQEALVRMARMAANHPRRVKPALQLISGGAL